MSQDQKGTKVTVNAEELFVQSKAAGLVGCGCFHSGGGATKNKVDHLKKWLLKNKPSQVKRSSGVGWIFVRIFGSPSEKNEDDMDKTDTADETEVNVRELAKKEWDSLEGEKTMEMVNMIAKKYDILSGKWMYHVSRELIDIYWSKLAIALVSGDFGTSVKSMKISPANDVAEDDEEKHLICVYNPDYRDTVQVMRVESLMRSVGIVKCLSYKPDIFTILGIYRANKWGFRPSIFASSFMPLEGRSQISVVGSGIKYYNSSQGFENPIDQDFDKITAQITASLKI